jgi:RimJ/RimL family protein N-acetyltransferase
LGRRCDYSSDAAEHSGITPENSAGHGIGFWAIRLSDDSQLAGFCGFRFIDTGPEIELLYGLKGEYWGQGVASEAALAAIEYLWRSTGFRQVFARTDAPNEASIRVMLRLGMTHATTRESMIAYVLLRPKNGQKIVSRPLV